MNIVNLTPHNITLCGKEYPGAGDNSARMEQEDKIIKEIDGIPIYKINFNKTINLPAPTKDTIFIVSRIVAENNMDRDDIFMTCKPIRDKGGKIIGCKGLSVMNKRLTLTDLIERNLI